MKKANINQTNNPTNRTTLKHHDSTGYLCTSAGTIMGLMVVAVLIQIIFTIYTPTPAHASYSISMTSSGPQSIDVLPDNSSSGGIGTSIAADNISVSTTCPSGYNFSMSASVSDNNLYLNGSSSNNQSGKYFSPASGSSSLANSANIWGYYYNNSAPTTAPTSSNIFSAVPALGSTASIKTSTNTSDSFNIYYGVSANNNLSPGTYKMIPDSNNSNADGSIVYYLTMAESCLTSNITFLAGDIYTGYDNITQTLAAGSSVPVVNSKALNLSTNTDYTVSFDYVGSEASNQFDVDFFPDDLPQILPTATTSTQHMDWTSSSSSSNMNSCHLRFFDDVNRSASSGSITISNILLSRPNVQVKQRGTTLGSLPAPTKTGFTFNGWYTAPSGGTQVTESTLVPDTDTTYYAHWTTNTHRIDINPVIDGTVYGGGLNGFTFDVYINGVQVADDVMDWASWAHYHDLTYGTTVRVVGNAVAGYTLTTGDYSFTVDGVTGSFSVPVWESVYCTSSSPCMQTSTVCDIELTDARDGKTYTTASIFGLCWTTKNLDLSGGTTLIPATSNVSSNYTLPNSSTSGFSDNNTAYVYNSNNTNCGTASSPCYSYYSFVAATAGGNPSSGNAESDICPANWRLPTANEYYLIGSTYTTGSAITSSPWLGVYNGYYSSSGLTTAGGSYGRYWSSSGTSTVRAVSLNISPYYPTGNDDSYYGKYYGLAVRCLRKN